MKLSLLMFSEGEYEAFYPVKAFASLAAAEAFIVSCIENSTDEEKYNETWHITELEYVE